MAKKIHFFVKNGNGQKSKMVNMVIRPERPKDAKDEVKRPEGPPARTSS